MSLTKEKRSEVIILAKERPDLAIRILTALVERLSRNGQLKLSEGDEIILGELNRWVEGQA